MSTFIAKLATSLSGSKYRWQHGQTVSDSVNFVQLPVGIAKGRPVFNSMFVRLGTDYEIRNGGCFETIKNGADNFRCDSFQMARIVESYIMRRKVYEYRRRSHRYFS